jgi:beta-glucanase (GH16 family)
MPVRTGSPQVVAQRRSVAPRMRIAHLRRSPFTNGCLLFGPILLLLGQFAADAAPIQGDPTGGPPPVSSAPLLLPVGQSDAWVLVFGDEFHGASLDRDKWNTCYFWQNEGCTNAGNHELQWYLPDSPVVNDGMLDLCADRHTIHAADGKTYHYASAMVSTGRDTDDLSLPVKFSFLYGYAEIRAKIPRGSGLWPGFWTLPVDHSWPPEIDILEIIGSSPRIASMSLHYKDMDDEDQSAQSIWIGADYSANWHTFSVDWEPGYITWYIDGVTRATYTNPQYIPGKPMYLLANLAVGGDPVGAPTNTTHFPSCFQVDYIRVWQRNLAAT